MIGSFSDILREEMCLENLMRCVCVWGGVCVCVLYVYIFMHVCLPVSVSIIYSLIIEEMKYLCSVCPCCLTAHSL